MNKLSYAALFHIANFRVFLAFEKPNECAGCGKKYKNRRSLVLHIKDKCGKPPKWKCPYCDHRSHRKFNINTHITKKHRIFSHQI